MADELREVLRGEEAWVVGGAVRDELLARPVLDLDIACREPERAARAYARRASGAPFPLSDRHGAWRVAFRDGRTVDFTPLRHGIESDLATRDFTINAIARPLAGACRALRTRRLARVPARRLSRRGGTHAADLERTAPLREGAPARRAARGLVAAADPPVPARNGAVGARCARVPRRDALRRRRPRRARARAAGAARPRRRARSPAGAGAWTLARAHRR